jgi:hypothetical protein
MKLKFIDLDSNSLLSAQFKPEHLQIILCLLGGGKWAASCSGHLTSRERTPGNYEAG